ncbi:family 43 glycosylhydrolase [Tamlana sp. 2_MG-2023]|uniref:glycoside hydrolase family 117 protein n=1 Tax=unclassified Tamlana TaxID=2614803 RepID=UPI0026E42045|nr:MULTISPECIES: family 43 glycosylhydrolase [unclassified Tamlana]MDO6761323.1 family 43 glycosylhydrolase [Tamlana sp. 2_MG-2023]MDO6791806.1 family 43 glycosylhydrolase [Tamlana sp. 1_MG-2023]
MKYISSLIILSFVLIMSSCQEQPSKNKEVVDRPESIEPSAEQIDFLGITDVNHLSAASKRALKWDQNLGNEWFIEFSNLQPLKGDLAYEEGVVRRDPSAMIKHDGKYYVWYSKSVGKTDGFGGDIDKDKVFPWDRCDIWYATSEDGWTWKEEGLAVPRGEKGAYDDRSVFTVEIMEHEGMYYLCYQTVKSPYNVRVKNQVGLAWSNSPNGPWTKSEEPILSPADNGVWKGDTQNRFLVEKKGDFDSHKVHDPCIIPFNGKFYLYYKGEQMGEAITFGGRQIRHGVAIADNPKGPYVKSPYNPISNSGHEICVWPYNGGIASLITTDGPEKNTIQWAPDGLNFDIMSVIPGVSAHAIGLNRTADTEKEPTEILRWGLSHIYNSYDYQSIMRFESHRKTTHVAKGESSK